MTTNASEGASAMQVRVLGCSGAIAKDCRTTSFLVDSDLLVDAGTGVGDLTLDEMAAIDDVVLTHCHLDQSVSLPLLRAAVGGRRPRPRRGPALRATIDALRAHVFNNVIWPDFERIPSPAAPFVKFEEIAPGQVLQLGTAAPKRVEVLPAVHTVPACGFAVCRAEGDACWVFSGDTERNASFWERVNALDVAMLVIETTFSSHEEALAERSLHLSPRALADELAHIDPRKDYPIYITHTKPAETDEIMSQIEALAVDQVAGLARRDIRWLKASGVLTF